MTNIRKTIKEIKPCQGSLEIAKRICENPELLDQACILFSDNKETYINVSIKSHYEYNNYHSYMYNFKLIKKGKIFKEAKISSNHVRFSSRCEFILCWGIELYLLNNKKNEYKTEALFEDCQADNWWKTTGHFKNFPKYDFKSKNNLYLISYYKMDTLKHHLRSKMLNRKDKLPFTMINLPGLVTTFNIRSLLQNKVLVETTITSEYHNLNKYRPRFYDVELIDSGFLLGYYDKIFNYILSEYYDNKSFAVNGLYNYCISVYNSRSTSLLTKDFSLELNYDLSWIPNYHDSYITDIIPFQNQTEWRIN